MRTADRDRTLTVCPLIRMRPDVTSSRPLIMLRRVDFPQPDGPRMDSREPCSTATFSPSITVSGGSPRRGNCLRTLSMTR
jgi:hypothetical protein